MAKKKKALKKKQSKKVKFNKGTLYEVEYTLVESNTNFFAKFWNWLKSFV